MAHRIGEPAKICNNGNKEWWFYGNRHRLDGPAVEKKERTEYWQYGKLHRTNGPAIIQSDKWVKNKYYYYNDTKIIAKSDEEFYCKINNLESYL